MDISNDVTATLRAQDHGHPPVICFEPGILSRDCSAVNRAYIDHCSTLRAYMGDNQPAVCYAIDQQGGKGNCCYAENVMPTLCSDSHGTPHAVCFSIGAMNSEGMLSSNPHAGIHYTDVARTIDANGSNPAGYQGGNIVCYDARGNGEGGVAPTITGDHENRVTDYTAVLCYNDRRRADYHIADDGISPAVVAKYGTGGATPRLSCWAIDSHPMDSRIQIMEGACPSITAKLAKLASDGPLILMRNEE